MTGDLSDAIAAYQQARCSYEHARSYGHGGPGYQHVREVEIAAVTLAEVLAGSMGTVTVFHERELLKLYLSLPAGDAVAISAGAGARPQGGPATREGVMKKTITVVSTEGFSKGSTVCIGHRQYVVRRVDEDRRVLEVRRTFMQWLLDLQRRVLDWFA